ncbi:MAG TPA: NAD(P)H-dependent oxidoreductase subunit E [Candidatus Limnocylindria bacterium]|jgi:NADH:ubiquinone oxidoreductase subunit E|nr:NAD(P)H-dependent oxidoreductase subunit E [Candidatus Limnocylindria bacterium]
MAFPGIGIAKGMATTFKNFFAPKVTRQYPEQRPEIPDRWRGRLDLIYDPFGEHKCQVCFQCAQVCPVEAIDMSGFDSRGNRIRYGMPEIYDERKDPNAYRRAGLPARPMRNPARWDDAIDSAWVAETITGFGGRPESLVAIFRAVEDRFGYLPERALRLISDQLSIHWAQVFGAAGLGGFRLLPVEGHVVTVCDCASCRFAGGPAVLAAVVEELGVQPGETTPDGAFTLEVATDVGAGTLSPAIRVDTLVYGPLDAIKAQHIVHERRAASAAVGARS